MPPDPVKAAAVEVQRSLAGLEWLRPTPAHFLHVTICHAVSETYPARPAAAGPFEVAYRGLNCFPEAVVVEVHGDGPERLVGGDTTFYLPHLTLAYVCDEGPAEVLREKLLPLRKADLGTGRVDEVLLCRVPASRETIFQPWTVLERLPLRGGRR